MRSVTLFLACAGLASPVAAQVPSTLLFKTGDPAPNTASGVTFSGFAWPQANVNGQVMFYGTLQGTGVNSTNNAGLWVAGSGGGLAARTGMQAPGCATFETFASVHLHQQFSASGLVAFDGRLNNVSFPNNLGYWAGGPGTLGLVARTGNSVPGQPGMTFGQTLQGPLINASGTVAFITNVVDQPSALFIGTGSGVTPYLRPGVTPAPGIPGATFNFYQLDNFNSAGHVAFYGRAQGGGVTSANDNGIWSGAPNNLSLIAREGFPVPAGVPGANLTSSFSPPWLNDQGQVLFNGSMSGGGVTTSTDTGVWFGSPGAMTLLAREGSPASSMPQGVNYGDLNNSGSKIRLANGGIVAIRGFVTGSSVTTATDNVLWVGTPDNLAAPIREGDLVPNETGLTFAEFPTLDDSFSVSSRGLAAVKAKMAGPGVSDANDDAIWVAGPGFLAKIAREGDVIDLDPGPGEDMRTINSLGLTYETFKGDYLAWNATFIGGTEAAFLTAIPIPESNGLLLIAVTALGSISVWYLNWPGSNWCRFNFVRSPVSLNRS